MELDQVNLQHELHMSVDGVIYDDETAPELLNQLTSMTNAYTV